MDDPKADSLQPRRPPLRRAILALHLMAGGAAAVAGMAHIASVRGKIVADRLRALTDVRPDVLYGVGALLVAAGLFTLASWIGLWRAGRARTAIRAAGVELFVVLWISLVFLEPRGLPLALAPLADLALLVPWARSRAAARDTDRGAAGGWPSSL